MMAQDIGGIIMRQEAEIEGRIFMFNKINVDYSGIVENEQILIEYLSKYSDTFSFTVVTRKPYSQDPPIFKYSEQLAPYAAEFIFDKKDWPVDFLGQLKHQIMMIGRCCKESRKELLKMPNLFSALEYDVPEDICFYRKGKLWFATVTHEKMAFILNPTKQDLEFLGEHQIDYCNEG